MGILQENNIDLETVASGLGLFDVETLVELDNEGDTKLFNDVNECFEWLFIVGHKRVEEVADTMLRMASLSNKDFTGTVAELLVSEQSTVILDDGRVVFIYQ